MSLPGRPSLTLRLTLLFAAVSTTVLLLLGLLIGSLVERHFAELDGELLASKLELLRHRLERTSTATDLPALVEDALVGQNGMAVLIRSADGKTRYASPGAAFPAALLTQAANRPPLRWQDSRGHTYRGLAGPAATALPGEGPALIAVSTDLAHHEHFMHSFNAALWTVVTLAALLSGVLGWLAARRGLAPLRDIARRAAGITASRLDQRLEDGAIPAELAEVVHTLNAMLARLETSFRRLSDFASDLAHELRTPVSNLLTQTQVTLSQPRSPAQYQDILASNAEEFERLSRMIADMLFLAKADNELIVPHREAVDLGTEVDSLLEFYAVLAEDKGLALRRTGDAQVQGDRLMLRRAIGNLLSNAFAHTPEGGTITVHLATGPEGPSVAVENSGATIPPPHLPRLFDRFYRADPARQRLQDGVGLGLAITRSIARAHGGDVAVQSADGLTTFSLTLPGHNFPPREAARP